MARYVSLENHERIECQILTRFSTDEYDRLQTALVECFDKPQPQGGDEQGVIFRKFTNRFIQACQQGSF